MQVVYRLLLWTLVFCRFTSQEESCSGDLGMQSKRIPDGRITASSSKSSVNSPHFARLDGAKAWCSAPKDKLPYIQITLVEPKSITGITTQGSKSDFAWVKKYEVKYLDKGTWKEYDKEFEGNNNINGLKSNTLDPPIRTQLIRIYPKDPIVLGGTDPKPCCLRLELSGCSAPVDCKDPGHPSNGNRNGSDFGHGKQVNYACLEGFMLVGSATSVCHMGAWSHGLPQCEAVCRDPGMPDNGTRIGENFGDGQMVAYRCNPNFNLVGSPTSFCIAGHWNTTKPTCKASCLDPGIPSHARRIGSNFGHGGQVTFVCLKDFTRLGNQSMTCHDGKWSSIIPVCKASCKDPGTPKNGVRHGNEFTHNKRISFACLAGFQLTGTPNVVCINGKWSASTPQCKAVCVDPGKPVNGSRIGDTFLDGQAVAFSCRPSHTLIGAPILRCIAGKWNKPTPKCKASCPVLVALINGRAIDFKPCYHHGEQAKFSCDSGFKLIGSLNIRCLDGKWSSATPLCKATCNDLGVPLNGKRKGNTFIDGDTVEFICDENFSLIGSSISRCLGGRWSSALPECKASCPDPGIPVNGERVNGSFGHGKHLQFRCKPGFWLVGSQLIVCREGTWSNEIPTCRAACPDPGIPRHGRRIGSNFGHGGQVTFVCLKDFTRLGSQSMTCHDGKWSSVLPVCKASCLDPGIPRHGRRIGSNFGHGGQVTFVCLKDFTRLGSQSMTCHDGKWSSVVPVCKASCKDPGTPKNGVRHGNVFTHNKRISFACLAGFQLTGTPNVVCINGKWSASTPQCKAVCVDPGKPVNGSRIGDTFLDGQVVAFSCRPSHTLIGAPILRCVAGKWNKPTPKCKASCPDPVVPVNGRAIDFQPGYRHGEQAKFSCDSGFKLIGSSAIRCLDGKWSSKAPLCKARSDPPSHTRAFRLCSRQVPGPNECHPENWLFDIQVLGTHSTYWITCSFDNNRFDVMCKDIRGKKWDHQLNSVICYKVRCP